MGVGAVSAGAQANDLCQVTDQSIDLGALVSRALPDDQGAQVVFAGVVRNINLGRQVVAVEYEAFAPMAENVFREFAAEARQKFGPTTTVTIVHRVGRLNVGEASVAIIVTTRHRDECYRASRYVIEELKKRAPVWKKEFYTDGETEWVQGHALCGHHHDSHSEQPHSLPG